MLHRYLCTGVLVLGAMFITVVRTSPLVAQQNTLNRQYDAIVVENLQPFVGLTISELAAYHYTIATDAWTQIPFQVDEVAAGKFFVEQKGTIDNDDEICFMARDAGDRAGVDKWLNDPGARQNPRIEVEVADPLNPGQAGWIYVYRKLGTQPPVPAGYLTYVPDASGVGADTIKGRSYVAAHALNGWPNYATIVTENGSSANLLDRQKTRAKGVATVPILGSVPYELTEDNGLQYVSDRFGGGAVRGLRELRIGVAVPLLGTLLPIDTVAFVTQYFAYSNTLGAKDAKIDSAIAELAGVSLIRQSMDLNANVLGQNMRFYDAFNTGGVSIDGNIDRPDSTVLGNELNWMMATGQPGAILVLITVPPIGSERWLYYRDNSAGGTGDGTVETGDGKSYGDFGIRITGTKIQGQFSFDLTTFFLDPSVVANPVETGTQFKSRAASPANVTATEQSFTTSVADQEDSPNVFALYEAYPNPFSPAKEPVRLALNLGASVKSAGLHIYNLLGQEVARFTTANGLAATTGRQEIAWNGKDFSGRNLPAGIYFYRLQAGDQVAVKKFVLVR